MPTIDQLRDKIPVKRLLFTLQKNAFRKLNPPLTQNELHSIKLLLGKALPDLSQVAVDLGGDVTIQVLKVDEHKPAK